MRGRDLGAPVGACSVPIVPGSPGFRTWQRVAVSTHAVCATEHGSLLGTCPRTAPRGCLLPLVPSEGSPSSLACPVAWGPPPATPVPGVEIGRVGGRRRRPRTHGSCPDKPTTTVSRSRSRIKRHEAWSVPTCPQEAVITPDEAVLVWPLPQSSPVHRPQVALPRAGCGTPGCPHAPCARLSPSSWTSLPRPAPDSFNCSAPWLKSLGNSRSWRPSARLGATLEGGGPREAEGLGERSPPSCTHRGSRASSSD